MGYSWYLNFSAGSRIFVQGGIYDKFLDHFTEQTCAIEVGDPFLPHTYEEPQVSKTQFQRSMEYITSGRNDGATVHLGGKQILQERPLS
ncbi:hypothetical protein BDR07DRAFT_1421495 [Suillus spraguei]|nr:hypothetical protein BDR07DRAFT_1421495 [Suillus spraguei]